MTTPTPVVGADPTPSATDSHDARMALDPIYAFQREQEAAAAQRAADRTAGPTPTDPPPAPAPMPLVATAGGPLASYDPTELQRTLTEGFEAALARLRDERGQVLAPEDVHGGIRAVADVAERADEFAHAFAALSRRAAKAIEEELIEGNGDQDGIPNGGMTVRHGNVTLKLALDNKTVRVWDRTPALAGLVALVEREWEIAERDPALNTAQFALEVAGRAIDGLLTKSDMSIKGVEELARELGAHELDKVAGLVRTAEVSKTSKYVGVKLTREIQKPKARK